MISYYSRYTCVKSMTYLLSKIIDELQGDSYKIKSLRTFQRTHNNYFEGVEVAFLRDVYNPAIVGIEIGIRGPLWTFWKTPEYLVEVSMTSQLKLVNSETEISNSNYWLYVLIDYFLIQGNINKYCTSLRDFEDYSSRESKEFTIYR